MGSGPNWYQIGNKYIMYQKVANFDLKKITNLNWLENAIFGHAKWGPHGTEF